MANTSLILKQSRKITKGYWREKTTVDQTDFYIQVQALFNRTRLEKDNRSLKSEDAGHRERQIACSSAVKRPFHHFALKKKKTLPAKKGAKS